MAESNIFFFLQRIVVLNANCQCYLSSAFNFQLTLPSVAASGRHKIIFVGTSLALMLAQGRKGVSAERHEGSRQLCSRHLNKCTRSHKSRKKLLYYAKTIST